MFFPENSSVLARDAAVLERKIAIGFAPDKNLGLGQVKAVAHAPALHQYAQGRAAAAPTDWGLSHAGLW
jgi:hypothetical protein